MSDRKNIPIRGRPCLLTKRRKKRLLAGIESGLPLKEAAMLAGVSYDSLNRWRVRGESMDAPLRFRHFCKALKRSQAVAMLALVSRIQSAGKRDWKAAAWLLERRHPEDFGRKGEILVAAPTSPPIEPVPEVSHEILQRIRKQGTLVTAFRKLGAELLKAREEKNANTYRGRKPPPKREVG